MTKNRMMRLASGLLVAVLLTTCAISGTFAKYVTTASGSDSARVAKWGITMMDTGTGFKANYDDTVVAGNGTDTLVAPGTKHSTTYEVDGTPETDYVIDFEGTTYTKDIYLGEGAYTYAATNVDYLGMNATLTSEQVYYPLEWKITIKTENGVVSGDGWIKNEARTFPTLNAAMNALAAAEVSYQANVACDMVVSIEWEWDYDTSKPGDITDATYTSNDVYDTILGDLAAGATTNLTASSNAKYELGVEFTVKMTATQID